MSLNEELVKREQATADARLRPIDDEDYRKLVETVGDYAIFFVDPAGRIASWSRAAQRIHGSAADEILGQPLTALYTPNDVAALRPQYALRIAASEGRFEEEGWRVRKDGSMFWGNVILTAIRTTGGELKSYAVVMRDLTERKHADEAQRHSEERYRLLVASVKDYAIFMLDPEGRVVSWNDGAQRLKGYKAEEILGRHLRVFYSREDQDRKHPEEELATAAREGRYEEEGWRYRKDGTRFWASVTLTAMRGVDGALRGFAKVTRDLTARKLAEEDMKSRASQYAALNRELETFSYTVAHDLRAPLRAVAHLTDLALNEGTMDDETRRTLDVLQKSAQRMTTLVENLLNLSRSTAGVLQVAPLDITRIAEEVGAEAARTFPRVGTRFLVERGLAAQGDPTLLRMALDNLVRNAFKFSARADTPVVEVGSERADGGIAFFVRDNGVGFDPGEIGDLFAPFRRLRSASSFEGSGIGLATVKRIVDRHGGRVWAKSAPGKGATFYFTLTPASER